MIPFRSFLRAKYLSAAGVFRKISPGIHVLNGHVIGMGRGANHDRFRLLLRKLSRVADFIRIEDACRLIAERREVGRPMIAFTFDDGFEDCYTDIAPVLEEFNTNALFFVNPNFAKGSQAYIDNFLKLKVPDIPPRRPMSADMIRDLSSRGFVIGAHTLDHERLVSQDVTFLDAQIKGCRAAVEDISGAPCEYFAWTYGGYGDISNVAIRMALDTYSIIFSSDQYPWYTSHAGRIINRRHFECDWPFPHVQYFLSTKRRYEVQE